VVRLPTHRCMKCLHICKAIPSIDDIASRDWLPSILIPSSPKQ
jgi:hypothetical protein